MNDPPPDALAHHRSEQRFTLVLDGASAVLDYRIEGDRMIITHTFVPPALRGRGLAEKLVRAALAVALADGRRVVPACSYVAQFIARHPEFQPLLT